MQHPGKQSAVEERAEGRDRAGKVLNATTEILRLELETWFKGREQIDGEEEQHQKVQRPQRRSLLELPKKDGAVKEGCF